MPSGTTKLLGLGLNYCIRSTSIRETTKHTFTRLADDAMRIYALRDVENDEGDYIPSLYIKSDYKFRPVPVLIERALATFETKIKIKQQDLRNRKRHPSMNLTHGGWNLVQHLKQHNDYVIVAGDKNLGPCILDRSVHLGNRRNYKVLTREGVLNRQQGFIIQLRNFISRYGPREDYREPVHYTCISNAEDTYLRRAVKKVP